jgi:transposase
LRLQKLRVPATDRVIIDLKLNELQQLQQQLQVVETEIDRIYNAWPEAQAVDAIRGIGVVSAVSILARIGQIERFGNAEQLIAFAGLAPGVRQSDSTRHDSHIGGGGTDKHLRYYLIEASMWVRHLPRYRDTYQRAMRRRGKKIGRLVVARLLLRSIFKMLRDKIPFSAERAAR